MTAISANYSAWQAVRNGEAMVVDVRSPAAFADAHPQGALSLPYSAKRLAERLGCLTDEKSRLVLVAEETDLDDARGQLGEAGFKIVGSMIGLDQWIATGLPVESVAIVELDVLGDGGRMVWRTVVDVREPIEWDTGYVPGALLVPLGELSTKAGSLHPEGAIAVICEAGVRSSTAVSILQRAGLRDVGNVIAGTAGYRRAGLPLAFPAAR